MGCRRCENCIRGLYTACLNYGNRRRGHRANGFTTNGGLAEYAVNHVNTLYKLPDHVSYDEAVVIMTAGSPLYGLQVAGGYFAGETVAVLGPGPIGLMALQLVKALGAVRVVLTGTRASRLALGRSWAPTSPWTSASRTRSRPSARPRAARAPTPSSTARAATRPSTRPSRWRSRRAASSSSPSTTAR